MMPAYGLQDDLLCLPPDFATGMFYNDLEESEAKHDYQLKTVEMAGFPKEKTETLEIGHIPWFTKPEEVRQLVFCIINGVKK